MLTNMFLFTGCLYSKYMMHKYRFSGRFFASSAMLGLIWFTIWDRKKFDFPEG